MVQASRGRRGVENGHRNEQVAPSFGIKGQRMTSDYSSSKVVKVMKNQERPKPVTD